MNLKTLLTMSITSLGLMISIFLNLSYESVMSLWLIVLTMSFSKVSNHFISLLLMLEMLSLSSLTMGGFYMGAVSVLNLVFVLMSLSVGEAVLGLAILVKLVRYNSSELVFTGLS